MGFLDGGLSDIISVGGSILGGILGDDGGNYPEPEILPKTISGASVTDFDILYDSQAIESLKELSADLERFQTEDRDFFTNIYQPYQQAIAETNQTVLSTIEKTVPDALEQISRNMFSNEPLKASQQLRTFEEAKADAALGGASAIFFEELAHAMGTDTTAEQAMNTMFKELADMPPKEIQAQATAATSFRVAAEKIPGVTAEQARNASNLGIKVSELPGMSQELIQAAQNFEGQAGSILGTSGDQRQAAFEVSRRAAESVGASTEQRGVVQQFGQAVGDMPPVIDALTEQTVGALMTELGNLPTESELVGEALSRVEGQFSKAGKELARDFQSRGQTVSQASARDLAIQKATAKAGAAGAAERAARDERRSALAQGVGVAQSSAAQESQRVQQQLDAIATQFGVTTAEAQTILDRQQAGMLNAQEAAQVQTILAKQEADAQLSRVSAAATGVGIAKTVADTELQRKQAQISAIAQEFNISTQMATQEFDAVIARVGAAAQNFDVQTMLAETESGRQQARVSGAQQAVGIAGSREAQRLSQAAQGVGVATATRASDLEAEKVAQTGRASAVQNVLGLQAGDQAGLATPQVAGLEQTTGLEATQVLAGVAESSADRTFGTRSVASQAEFTQKDIKTPIFPVVGDVISGETPPTVDTSGVGATAPVTVNTGGSGGGGVVDTQQPVSAVRLGGVTPTQVATAPAPAPAPAVTSSDLANLLAQAQTTGGGGVTNSQLEQAGLSRTQAQEVTNPGGI